MSQRDLGKALESTREIEITVTGRKSRKNISLPIWFVHEGKKLYLLPVSGSSTNWFKNVQKSPTMKISANGAGIKSIAKPISDAKRAKEVSDKFQIRCVC
jgi:hypothetical protein